MNVLKFWLSSWFYNLSNNLLLSIVSLLMDNEYRTRWLWKDKSRYNFSVKVAHEIRPAFPPFYHIAEIKNECSISSTASCWKSVKLSRNFLLLPFYMKFNSLLKCLPPSYLYILYYSGPVDSHFLWFISSINGEDSGPDHHSSQR